MSERACEGEVDESTWESERGRHGLFVSPLSFSIFPFVFALALQFKFAPRWRSGPAGTIRVEKNGGLSMCRLVNVVAFFLASTASGVWFPPSKALGCTWVAAVVCSNSFLGTIANAVQKCWSWSSPHYQTANRGPRERRVPHLWVMTRREEGELLEVWLIKINVTVTYIYHEHFCFWDKKRDDDTFAFSRWTISIFKKWINRKKVDRQSRTFQHDTVL